MSVLLLAVTSALYMIDLILQLPSSGQFALFLQFQLFASTCVLSVVSAVLLCREMMLSILGMQL